MKEKLISFFKQLDFSWRSIEDYLLILLGAFLQALSMRLFLVPASLVSGGISGIAQILHYTVGWPIGLVVLLGNIPLLRKMSMKTRYRPSACSRSIAWVNTRE